LQNFSRSIFQKLLNNSLIVSNNIVSSPYCLHNIIFKNHQDYKKRTRPKQNAHNAKRRAQKLDQTPPDADFEKIEKIYEEAKRLEEETGKPHHVDHKVPLSRGGKHHQDNLRPVPAIDNLRKGAKILYG